MEIAHQTGSRLKAGSLAIVTVGVLLLGAGAAQAGNCSGNGCEDIQIQKRGDCIVIANTGSKPIRIRSKGAGISSGVVYANSDFIPKTMDGSCLSSYRFDYSAFYDRDTEGGECKKVRPLRDLKYGSGHKTRFCRNKGYDGVTNFPGSRYRDYGGGFCFSGKKQACLEQMKGYPK